MKRWIIDYLTATGREDFKIVEAETLDDALRIFRGAGVDGWTGQNFASSEVTAISERR